MTLMKTINVFLKSDKLRISREELMSMLTNLAKFSFLLEKYGAMIANFMRSIYSTISSTTELSERGTTT